MVIYGAELTILISNEPNLEVQPSMPIDHMSYGVAYGMAIWWIQKAGLIMDRKPQLKHFLQEIISKECINVRRLL